MYMYSIWPYLCAQLISYNFVYCIEVRQVKESTLWTHSLLDLHSQAKNMLREYEHIIPSKKICTFLTGS